MRRVLVVIGLFILTSEFVNGQSFGIGGRAGLTITTLDVDRKYQHEYEFKQGWHIDGYLFKMFNNVVGLEGGVSINQTGYVRDVEAVGDILIQPMKTTLTYFSIPVSARITFGRFKRNPKGYFVFNPGVRTGFLIDSRQQDYSQMISFKKEFSTTDISLFASQGVHFPEGITLSSTFAYGLTHVIQNSKDFRSNNFVVQITVGYLFLNRPR